MATLVRFDTQSFLTTMLCLSCAFVLGGLIGLERQIRQRNAGLRTMVLVAVGAAAFVHLGGRIFGAQGQTQVIAYVVSGIGFLGAGVIIGRVLGVGRPASRRVHSRGMATSSASSTLTMPRMRPFGCYRLPTKPNSPCP